VLQGLPTRRRPSDQLAVHLVGKVTDQHISHACIL